ncbi:beta-lactamase [Enterococcus haemoperoxidus ATCC BAA-382]|uniref:Beta-lactamase n=1 Tax=Enterococcus haemoperoxidus ATCC BAA-382 TaxID=1158608 RepID=R2SH14_9ENTE|nr:serine hydrolase domain-containing protein [Enterococcus haemoperoxidus]EOH92171.1 beta-lactamase [Enterococcus haemoperoxidus ATCC BAA-382]EOT61856.1 beta-lactamase [Enterococcus haemoperoxidus ATCC BAA-382]OJG54234.1 beta-lactamase [Enterococcus haemoperoxidus]
MYEKTKAKIKELMEDEVFPGVSFSFIMADKSEDHIWGNAQIIPTVEPLKPALLFDVASLTKVVCTTTVVLQLAEAGVINIDVPFKHYYSVFEDEKITIRHLLTHTSDIQSYIENRDTLSKEELKAAYNQVQSGRHLGEKVAYTDTGTILLGFMLEEMVGKEAIEIFKERVLQPLDMKESIFLPTDAAKIVPTEAHPIRGLIRGQTHDPKAFVLAEHAGNAGLFTNLTDLKKFTQMYLNEGSYQETKVLEKRTVRSLLVDQTPNKRGNRSLGWDLKDDLTGRTILFHTGYTGTFLLIDPTEKEAFIFLSNRVHPIDKRAEYIEKRDELIEIYLQEKITNKDESLSF